MLETVHGDFIDAARADLWASRLGQGEEVGDCAARIGRHIWTREHAFRFAGIEYRQREHIFVA